MAFMRYSTMYALRLWYERLSFDGELRFIVRTIYVLLTLLVLSLLYEFATVPWQCGLSNDVGSPTAGD